MKKLILLSIVFCCFFLNSCDLHIVNNGVSIKKGNNPNIETTEVEFDLEAFNGIEASSIFDIQVVKSDTQLVKITIDKTLEQILDIKVKNGKLVLNLQKGEYTINVLKVVIHIPELQSIDLSGACSLVSSDTFTPQNFNVDLSGSSLLDLKLQTPSAHFDLSGACTTNLFIETSNLNIDASGSNEVKINGKADNLKISLSGNCGVDALNLKAADVSIESSGCSSITVQAEKKLTVDASGASDIRYTGQPIVNINTSGSASVKAKK